MYWINDPKLESIDDLLQLHLIVLNSVEKSTESGCLKILCIETNKSHLGSLFVFTNYSQNSSLDTLQSKE